MTVHTKAAPVLAWHFVGATLRDGCPIPADGVTLKHTGEIVLCKTGLHASERLIDALSYASGATLCRVECAGRIELDSDKLVCSSRTILWRLDATQLLGEFARRCAWDVAHVWDAPEIVLTYLRTGNEEIRAAADAAVRAATDAAVRGAVGYPDGLAGAARAAADAAVRAVAPYAARAAAEYARAAVDVTEYAARAADAAEYAAWRAADAAARAVALWATTRATQNDLLVRMVTDAHAAVIGTAP